MGVIVTKEIDRGYKKARSEIQKVKIKRPHVAVGFQGESGGARHPEGDGATVADVATFNEFGTKDIPERSFIRSTMDEEKPELLRLNKRLFRLMSAGKMTTERALNILGLKIKALIQKKITDLKDPPNHPKTIARKKSSNPLIDTGTMRQSVTFKVKRGGEQ